MSSSQRRSASRWNRAWSQISWSARSPLALAPGQLAHQAQVLGALGVEQVGRVAAGQQREDDLRVEGGLQVRLRLLRLREPPLDVGDAGVGDRVALAVRARRPARRRRPRPGRSSAAGTGSSRPGRRRAGGRAEPLVVGPLQVVAVAGLGLQQPQQRVTDGHARRLYTMCIPSVYTRLVEPLSCASAFCVMRCTSKCANRQGPLWSRSQGCLLSLSTGSALGRFARTRRRSPHFSPRETVACALQPDREGEPVRLPNLSNKAKLAAVAAIVAVPAVALPIAFATKDGGLPGVGSGGDDAAYAFPVTPDHIPDTPVRVNQVGYLPDGPKRATVISDATTPLPWQLKDKAGTVVASRRDHAARHGPQLRPGHAHGRLQRVPAAAATRTPSRSTARRACPSTSTRRRTGSSRSTRCRSTTRSAAASPIDDKIAPGYGRAAGHTADTPNGGDTKVPCQPGACDYSLDVTGGWYDAGDHGKYVVNGGISVAQLMSVYERSPKARRARRCASPRPATRPPTCSTRPAGSWTSCQDAGPGRAEARRHGPPQGARRRLDRAADRPRRRHAAAGAQAAVDRRDPQPGRRGRAGRPGVRGVRQGVRRQAAEGGPHRVRGGAGQPEAVRAGLRLHRRRRLRRHRRRPTSSTGPRPSCTSPPARSSSPTSSPRRRCTRPTSSPTRFDWRHVGAARPARPGHRRQQAARPRRGSAQSSSPAPTSTSPR